MQLTGLGEVGSQCIIKAVPCGVIYLVVQTLRIVFDMFMHQHWHRILSKNDIELWIVPVDVVDERADDMQQQIVLMISPPVVMR